MATMKNFLNYDCPLEGTIERQNFQLTQNVLKNKTQIITDVTDKLYNNTISPRYKTQIVTDVTNEPCDNTIFSKYKTQMVTDVTNEPCDNTNFTNKHE